MKKDYIIQKLIFTAFIMCLSATIQANEITLKYKFQVVDQENKAIAEAILVATTTNTNIINISENIIKTDKEGIGYITIKVLPTSKNDTITITVNARKDNKFGDRNIIFILLPDGKYKSTPAPNNIDPIVIKTIESNNSNTFTNNYLDLFYLHNQSNISKRNWEIKNITNTYFFAFSRSSKKKNCQYT